MFAYGLKVGPAIGYSAALVLPQEIAAEVRGCCLRRLS
jgi:hypothetical protein